eukprot:3891329-Pleurochrysis_carterae.AAC.1
MSGTDIAQSPERRDVGARQLTLVLKPYRYTAPWMRGLCLSGRGPARKITPGAKLANLSDDSGSSSYIHINVGYRGHYVTLNNST